MERTLKAPSSFRTYIELSKPGIIMGNILTALGGASLAMASWSNWPILFWGILGMTLVMASACALNNCIDKDFDAKMIRTRSRALPAGLLSTQQAFLFAVSAALVGFFFLAYFVNMPSFLFALLGFSVYVFCYSFLKHHSPHATLIGSLAGATPPVIGYCALSGKIDLIALMLFIALVMWQMPHFYAIALFRKRDYEKASLPVLPVARSIQRTRNEMLLYTLGFFITMVAFYQLKIAGLFFLIIMSIFSAFWVGLALKGFKENKTEFWARQMFFASLFVILGFSATLRF